MFIFNGPEPLFPLPFFSGERDSEFVAGKPAQFTAQASWYMVSAHGFDAQHFATVHGRKLVTPLAVDCPAPYARRSRYRAEIIGNKYYDRLLRRGLSRQVTISITTWGGTLVMISGDFGGLQSLFMIALEPLDEQRTACSVVVFKKTQSFANGTMALRSPQSWGTKAPHSRLLDR